MTSSYAAGLTKLGLTFLLLAFGIALLGVVSTASAGPTVESTISDGDRTIRQQLAISTSTTVHYHVAANDPTGLYPFCVRLRLEKKTREGWRGIGRDSQRLSRDCFDKPSDAESSSEAVARWDAFVYPRGRLAKRFKNGKLRAHGSTDLGADIAFRW